MNEIIKKQLESCTVAEIPSFDINTTVIRIPKQTENIISKYQLHRFYLVEFHDDILYPSANDSLSANWNKGTHPVSKYNYVEVAQVMGKMIRVNACGYDITTASTTDTIWEGWIPSTHIKILKEL